MKPKFWTTTLLWKAVSWNRIRGITTDGEGNLYFTTCEQAHIWFLKKNGHSPEAIGPECYYGELYGLAYHKKFLYVCARNTESPYKVFKFDIENRTSEEIMDDEEVENIPLKPKGVTVDKDGNLLLADTRGSIRKIDLAAKTISTFAGGTYCGYQDGTLEQARFNYSCCICTGSDGSVYVGEWNNSCIRKISNGVVTTVAGSPLNTGSQDGPLEVASFGFPRGVAEVGNKLIVADQDLRQIDWETKTVLTLASFKPSMGDCCAVAADKEGIYFSVNETLYKLEFVWKYIRLLWIGHSKEPCSPLACLPKDLVNEVIRFVIS